jgi:hypothetical protein
MHSLLQPPAPVWVGGCACACANVSWASMRIQLTASQPASHIRACVQGVPPELRADVWKFLLELYPCTSPLLHRLEYIETASARYSELLDTALDADAAGDEVFRQHRKIIDKDVPRTDRDHPFFAGDDNPNLVALQNILLAHTILDPELGYVQGMNDIAGTILYGEACHVPPRPSHASADCPRPQSARRTRFSVCG